MAAQAGKYRYHVSVEQDTPTRDTDGHETPVWALVAKAQASIEPAQGREFWAGAALVGKQPVEIRMRYDSRFSAMEPGKWRITYDGTEYDIISAINVGLLGAELHIMCTTGTGVASE